MDIRRQRYYYELCNVAQSKGGQVITNTYVNSETYMIFQCQYGHQWETQPKRIKNGTWCPVCADRSPKSAETKFIQNVQSKGGKVISNYINARTKVEVECNLGHRWWVTPNHINSHGSWCKICADGSEIAKQEFYQIVTSKGGKVHGQYVNNNTVIEVECYSGHRFFIRSNHVKSGQWCRNCAFGIEETEKDFRQTVASRGGKVLGKYIDTYTNVLVECVFGHQWMGNTSWIRRGTWCPRCKQSRGESCVSEFLNKYRIPFTQEFKHPLLPNKRYDFYFVYNGIHYVVEFDGIQHFEFNTLFHSSQEEFNYKQNIDRLKTYIATSTGYRMIRIDHTKLENVHDYLIQALQSSSVLFVSTPELYQWLSGSTIPLELFQKECSV